MKPHELEVGYVVVFSDGNIAMVMPSVYGICLSGPNVWFPIDNLNESLTYFKNRIDKVYGRAYPVHAYNPFSLYGRDLLWKRPAGPKTMTQKEIEKALGYSINLINEVE